ncbi:MAG TPA: hypothetical protein DEF34_04905 [Desulfotomaculum sp.]|nr:MAG: hypothetical protein JL56_13680 [Desulfotomaculum sp. BICA1-6]HBX22957.1 hypothetical protein [Desulfotomaculum sp.]
MEHQGLNNGVNRTEENEISLGEIISALFKWWWLVILCTVLAALGAYFYTIYTYVPVYTASASMVVNSKQLKIVGQEAVLTNDVNLSAKLVNTYTAVLTSNRVMELVAGELDLPAAAISPYVSVAPVRDTEVLRIFVSNPDPLLAAKICNSIMHVAPTAISSTVEVGSINVLDNAKVPEFPNAPATFRNVGVGAVLGLMLGLGIVFMLMFFDRTIKSGDDVKNKLGLTLLGSIPYLSPKARKDQGQGQGAPLVNSDQVGFGFVESYKAAGTNLRFASAVTNAKKLLVTSILTGEGKSTVAVNLAITIAHTGKSVLLVDCDLRKSNMHGVLELDLEDNQGLAAVLNGACAAEECIVFATEQGIHVMPNGYIVPNPSELLGSEKMAALLAALEKQYDYIILDTPPAYLLTDAVALSVYANGVILVVKQGCAKVDVINSAQAAFENAGVRIIGCILNGIKYNQLGAFYQSRNYERFLGDYYKNYALTNKPAQEAAAASDKN